MRIFILVCTFFLSVSHGKSTLLYKPEDQIYRLAVTKNESHEVSGGSAFAVINSNTLITNYHVVDKVIEQHFEAAKVKKRNDLDQDKLLIKVFYKEHSMGQAVVTYFDAKLDLAILHLTREGSSTLTGSAKTLIPMPLAKAPLKFKDKIFSLGYSGLGDLLQYTEGYYTAELKQGETKHLAISSILNPGMSGGPTFNSKNEIVGINKFVLKNMQSQSYLVPSDTILSFLAEYKKKYAEASGEISFQELKQKQMAEIYDLYFKQVLISLRGHNQEAIGKWKYKVAKGIFCDPPEFTSDSIRLAKQKKTKESIPPYEQQESNCYIDSRQIPVHGFYPRINFRLYISNLVSSSERSDFKHYEQANSIFNTTQFSNYPKPDSAFLAENMVYENYRGQYYKCFNMNLKNKNKISFLYQQCISFNRDDKYRKEEEKYEADLLSYHFKLVSIDQESKNNFILKGYMTADKKLFESFISQLIDSIETQETKDPKGKTAYVK